MNRLLFPLFLLLLIVTGNKAYSQEVIYTTYDKFDSRNGDFAVVGKVGGRLFTYRADRDGYYLDAWDDSMNRTATVVLDFFPEKINETQFVTYPDKMVVLYQSNERGTINQYAARLDGEGRLQGAPLKIASEKTGFFGSNSKNFSVSVSDDKKTITIYSAQAKRSTINIAGQVFDDNLTVKRRINTTYSGENDLSTGAMITSNDGSLYLPVYTRTGGRDYADGVWVLRMPTDAARFTATEFPLEGKYAANTYLRMDAGNQKLYVAGFYSEKKTGNFEGVFYTQYDVATGSYSNRRLLPFGDNLRNATGVNRTSRAFNNYEVRNLIVKNDGGFVLLAESYYMNVRSSGPMMGGYYSYYYMSPMATQTNIREYHYDDIVALSYSAEGNLTWSSFIRKDQYSQEDAGMFSSYGFFNTGGALGFLYNDYGRNRSAIQLSTIDGDGQSATRSMAAGSANDPDWLPRSGKQVAAREFVVPCLRKKQVCFAKIIF